MKTQSISIKNIDWIITQNSSRDILKNKSVYIEEGRIVEISDRPIEADFTIDGKNKVLLPGLINSHTHSSMTLFRGFADDMPLESWLKNKIWPLESSLKPKDCYFGSLSACLEMIKFGVTCFNDMYIFCKNIAKAVEKGGLRCFLGEVIFDWNAEEKIPYFNNFAKKYRKKVLINPTVNPHAPYSCSLETLSKLTDISRRMNLLVHMHVSETEREVREFQKKGKTPVEYLKENDILGGNFIAVHCNWLTKSDISIFSDSKSSVVCCPTSCMKLGNGRIPDIEELARKKIKTTVGTDGCASNNNLDVFEEMKNLCLTSKMQKRDPAIFSAQKALDMATLEAAKIFKIPYVGTVQEKKIADLILVDFKKPHLQPIHGKSTVLSNIVYSCMGQDVDTTIVNGRILMYKRKVLSLEESKVLLNLQKTIEKILKRAG